MALLRSIHFPILPTTSYCRQLFVLEMLILDLLKEHIHKCQYCTPTLEKRCFIGQELIHNAVNIVYKGLNSQIYSNIKENNILIWVKLPPKYSIVCRVLQLNTLTKN